jgi:hypothetical protein
MFNADLHQMVNSPTTEGLKRSIGFISICKRMDISTEAYRNSRGEDKAFALACESLEQDLSDILGEMTFGSTMKEGKPKDHLALAERVNSEQFGKKAEQHVHRVQLQFQQLPEESIKAFVEGADASVLHILKNESMYKSSEIKGLLNDES